MTEMFLPHEDVKLENPLSNPIELLAALIQGGFDVPPELEKFHPPPIKPEPDADDPLLELTY